MNYKIIDGYLVTNLGGVFSVKKRHFGNQMKQSLSIGGYPSVSLMINGEHKIITVHRLMARAFFGESELHVNHLDGIKTNNRLENLKYVTHMENMKHRSEMGLSPRGEKSGTNKLKSIQLPFIRQMIAEGSSFAKIAKMFNVSSTTISKIANGSRWAGIGLLDTTPQRGLIEESTCHL